MKPARFIHAITDLAIAFCFGGAVTASIAAIAIFRESASRGFERMHANVLAGEMFARVGTPLLIAACIAGVGCIFGALRPPTIELPSRWRVLGWRGMAVAGVLLAAAVGYMECVNNARMHELRRISQWEGGKLKDPVEQAEFDTLHKRAEAVYGFAILASAALLTGRRVLA